jgi:hypothetical protein
MKFAHYHRFSYTDKTAQQYSLFYVSIMPPLNLQSSEIDSYVSCNE